MTAMHKSWLATVLMQKQRYDQAKAAAQESLQLLEKVYAPEKPGYEYGCAYAVLGSIFLAENPLCAEGMDFMTRSLMVFNRLETLEEMASHFKESVAMAANLEQRQQTPLASTAGAVAAGGGGDGKPAPSPRGAAASPRRRARTTAVQPILTESSLERVKTAVILLNYGMGVALMAHRHHEQAVSHLRTALDYAQQQFGQSSTVTKTAKAALHESQTELRLHQGGRSWLMGKLSKYWKPASVDDPSAMHVSRML